jgi:threonine/homoserine/homoserine lactone efflux protein
MVNVSQFVSSSMTGPSPATTALSAILFFGIMLLLVMLPVAFFRVKIQDARRRAKFRKVHTNACLPHL